jgi:hypothetical protein
MAQAVNREPKWLTKGARLHTPLAPTSRLRCRRPQDSGTRPSRRAAAAARRRVTFHPRPGGAAPDPDPRSGTGTSAGVLAAPSPRRPQGVPDPAQLLQDAERRYAVTYGHPGPAEPGPAGRASPERRNDQQDEACCAAKTVRTQSARPPGSRPSSKSKQEPASEPSSTDAPHRTPPDTRCTAHNPCVESLTPPSTPPRMLLPPPLPTSSQGERYRHFAAVTGGRRPPWSLVSPSLGDVSPSTLLPHEGVVPLSDGGETSQERLRRIH